MFKPVCRIITSTPLVAIPAVAADAGTPTGITGIGPALFLFTIAGALLLTLIFRSVANLCIQTKHFNGIVFGDADEPQWTNVEGVHRQRFLNPLIQNEGRARALRKALPDVPVDNLVVFTGNVEFTSAPPRNVIHVSKLESYIAKHVFGPSKIKDWHAVWLTLQSAVLNDAAARKDFAAQISFG